ncbi:alcohol dehydrogenase ADH4 [Sugiyamaella lignohabitans]|uniref:Alcohol dehydrogenase ADH4 n=1 Tax=Sugiyamaella lignohabitans TaxID=796027 RepID=A0A167E1U9_9ASCO|nr:alcohol dehydrogenase ADH4 [Sugiyamaella lignohabitans]ANB13545.1 alcohol dehydrogenase ADH4 [Sugiyamaella lignohabitans]
MKMLIRTVRSKKQAALSLLKHAQKHPPACPCHGCTGKAVGAGLKSAASTMLAQRAFGASRNAVEADYAFEMSFSSIRYGLGVTREVGYDFKHLGADKVALFTDKNLLDKTAVKAAVESLDSQGIKYEIYSDVIVEPKDHGIRHAIDWARQHQPNAYLAVGGGSVMDTAKIANLFQTYPEADLMDFVNAPVGKGMPVERQVFPLIAVPTTAGTGSETTGTAIFDLTSQKSKTGIASRAIKPILGMVDPLNASTMPASVKASSGLDVLCHALESYTTIPYNQRTPRPKDPILRPAYQGANPISDIFCTAAMKLIVEYLPRSVKDPEDFVAQEQTVLAATLAGICLNNSGVHLAHGLSYPLSSQNKGYKHYGYEVDHPIIPHGVT